MDAVLSELIADLSRSHIQGLFDIGAVSIFCAAASGINITTRTK